MGNARHRTTGALSNDRSPESTTLYELAVHSYEANVDLSSNIPHFKRGDMTQSSPSSSYRVSYVAPATHSFVIV